MSGPIVGDETGVYARVIEDSINEHGHRLGTMEAQMHRFVLAEFNTHRRLSRNSASSRAIPVHKMIERVRNNPAIPLAWPAEQKGMQGGEPLSRDAAALLRHDWGTAADKAADDAEYFAKMGLHKSVTNRLLEPFMWHKVIVSSTEWDNFYSQRCSALAQPEIRAVAEAMREAQAYSEPVEALWGYWHTPYIDEDALSKIADYYDGENNGERTIDEIMRQVSAARCARVSYLTHDGLLDIAADLRLYDMLVQAHPPHWSPLEHQAVATPRTETGGNFQGWTQARTLIEKAA